jgi:hypothetical protein
MYCTSGGPAGKDMSLTDVVAALKVIAERQATILKLTAPKVRVNDWMSNYGMEASLCDTYDEFRRDALVGVDTDTSASVRLYYFLTTTWTTEDRRLLDATSYERFSRYAQFNDATVFRYIPVTTKGSWVEDVHHPMPEHDMMDDLTSIASSECSIYVYDTFHTCVFTMDGHRCVACGYADVDCLQAAPILPWYRATDADLDEAGLVDNWQPNNGLVCA